MQFDSCPGCGGEPQYGLRSHPKFSTCFSGFTDGEPDMVMVYFHFQEHNDAFASMATIETLYKQRWNHITKQWEEYS